MKDERKLGSGKKKIGGEAPTLPAKYDIKFENEEGKREYKVFVLDELLQGQMDEVNSFISNLELKDKGELSGNVLMLNSTLSKQQFYSKLLSAILRDEKGEKYSEEFFSKCIAKDVDRVANDFFTGEGASLINGIVAMTLSPLLKLKPIENTKD